MAKFAPDARLKCLHCQTVVKLIPTESKPTWMDARGAQEYLRIVTAQCPECGRVLVSIEEMHPVPNIGITVTNELVVWPLSSGMPPAPTQVPKEMAQDYDEAAIVLPFSAKASAALSRRCLQTLLRDAANTKAKDLSKQIEEVLPSLPSYIAHNLDAVRQIGNFAAHQQKSKLTGSIIDVETGEAEWNLEVLDALFDFYYVRPAIEQSKRDKLNAKLKEAGKPSLKKPDNQQKRTDSNSD